LKIFKTTLLLLFLSFNYAAGQQISLCSKYTTDGKPVDAKKNWEINPWGTYIHILYDNGGKPINKKSVYLFIDKLVNDSYEPFDSKVLSVASWRTWFVYDYKFYEAGTYNIYFMNSAQKTFASDTVIIKFKKGSTQTNGVVNSSYYDQTEFVFCDLVLANKPLNIRSTTYLTHNKGLIYIYLNNKQPFNTGELLVNIWRKKNFVFQYDELVASKKYKINPDWKNTFFTYRFTTPGEYKFSIYNENNVLIKTNYITVYK